MKSFLKVLIFYALFCISAISISLLGIYFLVLSEKGEIRKQIYLQNEYNSENNSSSKMFVELSKFLFPGDVISFRNNRGNYVIISKFATHEYECFGSCYCEEMENRRRAFAIVGGNLLQRGLIIIFSAASIALALKISSSFFEDECRRMFSKSCPEDRLFHEADSCKARNNAIEIIEDYVKKKEGVIEKKPFICKGKCLDIVESMNKNLVTTKEFSAGESKKEIFERFREAGLMEEIDRLKCGEHSHSDEIVAVNEQAASYVFQEIMVKHCLVYGKVIKSNKDVYLCSPDIFTIKCSALNEFEK